jgi:integrase
MTDSTQLRLEQDGERWQLVGSQAGRFGLVNDYLGYLADRNYSPRTGRAYGYDLLAFCRWPLGEDLVLEAVTTESLLHYLRSCREASVPGRPGVVSLSGVRADRYAPSTINHRLAAVTGLFTFRAMREPGLANPVPKGTQARRVDAAERNGLLGHLAVRPNPRAALRLREPRRLTRALDRCETTELLGSLRTWRDRAIAGLMLFCGLRSCEILALNVSDVDTTAALGSAAITAR